MGKTKTSEFKVSGIHCKSCIALIKMNIEELPGIADIAADEKSSIVRVAFDQSATDAKSIIQKIESGGYKAVECKGKGK